MILSRYPFRYEQNHDSLSRQPILCLLSLSLRPLRPYPITTFIPCSSSFRAVSQDALNGAIPPIWSVIIALRRRASCSWCIVDHCCSVFCEVPSRTAGGTTDKDARWVCIPLFRGINSKSTPPQHIGPLQILTEQTQTHRSRSP